jgi:hypothetical protein
MDKPLLEPPAHAVEQVDALAPSTGGPAAAAAEAPGAPPENVPPLLVSADAHDDAAPVGPPLAMDNDAGGAEDASCAPPGADGGDGA